MGKVTPMLAVGGCAGADTVTVCRGAFSGTLRKASNGTSRM